MTRPFSLSTMSGNFDFPPANGGDPPSSLDQATTIVRDPRSHRSALRRRLDEVRRLRDHMNDSDERQRLRMQQSTVREEIRRRHTAEQGDPPAFSNDNAQAPTSALRSRYGADLRHRAHARLQGRATPTGSGGTVQQAVERLNEASSNLSSLLDQPIPRIGSPEASAREYSGEAEVNRRRKRRKIDLEPLTTGHMRGFSYGYRGQVVPGPLKMEIVSCDGGLHTEAARHGREYWPENVLRNDKSVYCTDDSKCNLILRHIGETTFSLKKLVIKAPERGFTAPIQEGMIFVSMTSSDLLPRTAQYQRRDPSPLSQDDEEFNSLWDNADENRPLSRRRDSGSHRTIPPAISNSVARSIRYNNETANTNSNNNPFTLIDLGDDSAPPPRILSPPGNLGFSVETTCTDPSSDEEEPSSAATLADLYRRDRLPPPYASSSGEETEDGGLERAMRRAGRIGIPSGHRRSRRRAEPSRIEVVMVPVNPGTEAKERASEVLTPHAKFFIERERSVVSVKFDPPVSGKFILLKLWSPAKDQNIDIQSVVAHGFAGPRFFPAAQMM